MLRQVNILRLKKKSLWIQNNDLQLSTVGDIVDYEARDVVRLTPVFSVV